ncbi:MAG: hypothetical protein CAPSK01_002986 [Candidatus Accumulibacter vicinus]|uniref:Uncharacterized protein n=1 Tax=Candidatus Accumulibacter vicinus TaxID=2954382 RepID=A0A084XYJ9_9PROT|nr:MAG: hypothetical protein CAPSK01_002986 [Candidatus Accumulibacter vicinus]
MTFPTPLIMKAMTISPPLKGVFRIARQNHPMCKGHGSANSSFYFRLGFGIRERCNVFVLPLPLIADRN